MLYANTSVDVEVDDLLENLSLAGSSIAVTDGLDDAPSTPAETAADHVFPPSVLRDCKSPTAVLRITATRSLLLPPPVAATPGSGQPWMLVPGTLLPAVHVTPASSEMRAKAPVGYSHPRSHGSTQRPPGRTTILFTTHTVLLFPCSVAFHSNRLDYY